MLDVIIKWCRGQANSLRKRKLSSDSSLRTIVNQIKGIENSLGRFTIGDNLGVGGTAIVKKAELRGNESGRNYAVKFLLVDIADHKTNEYKRLRQAYINLASIQHLGCCVSLLYFGEHEERLNGHTFKIPYVIMPVADATMHKRYTKETKKGNQHVGVNFEEFLSVFDRLGTIIQIVHDYGIIHRDIKPQNIFYCSNQLYLADFDISKFSSNCGYVEAKTKKGDRLANMNFSAPEQFDSSIGEICYASDWFAFAQVMIWLKTGAPIVKGFKDISLDADDKRFRPYELLFKNLLQTDPKQRVESFEKINKFVNENNQVIQEQERQRAEVLRQYRIRTCLDSFLNILDFYTPHFNGLYQADLITSRDEIADLFARLNALMNGNRFGIVYEGGDIHDVKSFECIGDDAWRFVGYQGSCHYELSISGVIAYQHHNFGASFFVIIGQGLNREYDSNGTTCSEEFLRYKDHKLSVGIGQSARINEKLVTINRDEVEHVMRFVRPGIYFIGPLECPIVENYNVFHAICQKCPTVEDLKASLIMPQFANNIKRPQWIRLWD